MEAVERQKRAAADAREFGIANLVGTLRQAGCPGAETFSAWTGELERRLLRSTFKLVVEDIRAWPVGRHSWWSSAMHFDNFFETVVRTDGSILVIRNVGGEEVVTTPPVEAREAMTLRHGSSYIEIQDALVHIAESHGLTPA